MEKKGKIKLNVFFCLILRVCSFFRALSMGEIDCIKAAYNSSENIFKNNSSQQAWTIIIEELSEAGVCDNLTVSQCEKVIQPNENAVTSVVVPVRSKITKNSSSRRNWTVSETKCLISSYKDREHEFSQIRKKMNGWENIVQDLESADVLQSPVSPTQCETKIKSLLRAYKATIDAEKLTGQGTSTSKCLHFTELDEIFGNRPIISGAVTVSVGVTEVIKTHIEKTDSTPKKNDGKLINKLKLYTPNNKNSKKHDRMNLEKYKQEKKDSRFNEKAKLCNEMEVNKQKRHDAKLNMEQRKLEVLEKLAANLH